MSTCFVLMVCQKSIGLHESWFSNIVSPISPNLNHLIEQESLSTWPNCNKFQPVQKQQIFSNKLDNVKKYRNFLQRKTNHTDYRHLNNFKSLTDFAFCKNIKTCANFWMPQFQSYLTAVFVLIGCIWADFACGRGKLNAVLSDANVKQWWIM